MSTKTILDVSRYQGMIDWDAVVKIGLVDGVMLKTVSTNRSLSSRADGLYIDPTFERNYAECKRVGLPVGVYYYTYATTKAMADAELAVLKTALSGKTFEMPVCVDVEDNKLVKLSKDSLTALVDYELRKLEEEQKLRKMPSLVAEIEDALCEQDMAADKRLEAIEDSLCELDAAVNK